jgi:uncharacterized protein YjbI with pentapeptide repeats
VPGRSPRISNDESRDRLRADCEHCFALCCVAPAFTASSDFAISKDAGQPCPNLGTDFGCSIHDQLRSRGFAGCTTYDCFGAGQQVAQVTFGGRDWREAPGTARQMFAVFEVMRRLHELLWYLGEALALPSAGAVHGELRRVRTEIEGLTRLDAGALADLDADGRWQEANALLTRASDLARAEYSGAGQRAGGRRNPGPGGRSPRGADLSGRSLRGADLSGQRLRDSDLRGASLRGARLLGADLRGAVLTAADLTGADLRGTDLRGADLSGSIFLIQAQVDAAAGDQSTRLPAALVTPAHWLGSARAR